MLTLDSWSLLIGFLFIVAFSIISWVAAPKGENQTYVL
jgi:V-type H+-transporting ATPase subunit e